MKLSSLEYAAILAKQKARKKPPAPAKIAELPPVLAAFFAEHGIISPRAEYAFHHERKWRFDLAWPHKGLAVEVQGGIWTQGRHTRGAAMLREWEKLNAAAVLGWRILYCQPSDLMTADFAATIKRALL